MGKKKSLNLLYLLGMALVIIGFCCPIFKGKVFGGTSNGFSLLSDNGSMTTTAMLLIFIGACVGALVEVLKFLNIKIPAAKLLKLIALVVSIVGGAMLVITFTGNGNGNGFTKAINKAVGKGFFKNAYIGFWMIAAGWIAGLLGFFTEK